jgi:hypothetical protein
MTDEMEDWLEAFGTEAVRMAERDELHHYVNNPDNPTGSLKPGHGPPIIPVVGWQEVKAILAKIGPMPST